MNAEGARAGDIASSGYEALLALDQSILDAIPAAVYICSADGVIVRFNQHATELWGRTPKHGDTDERFCGSFRLYNLDGNLLPHANTPMEAALRTGEPQRDKEVVIEKPDGTQVVALVNIEPLMDIAGRIEGAINSFLDITQRRRAEVELQTSRSDLEDFFENAAVAMHWVSGDGTILRANKAELELLGYTSEDYVGRHIAEFHADQSRIDEILERLSCGETIDKVPARLRAKDGSIKYVLISSSTLFQDEDFVHTRCVTFDVTAEQAEQHLAAIVETSDDAIVSKDLEGIITSWNQGAERIFGYFAEEAVGKPITILIPADRQEEEPEILARLRRGERVDHYETVRQHKDGSLIDISLTISPVKDSEGRIIGASKIARDITERKKAEEQRSLLMRELSHRSKNLLALVQGMMQQAAESAPDMKTFEADFGARLQGLARSHDLLVAQDWQGALIAELVRSHLGFVHGGEDAVFTSEGPQILLTPAATQNVGLALHELATNAIKHGALSYNGGQISITWKVATGDGAPRLILTWAEHDGPRVKLPPRKGFGHSVVETVVPQALGGTAKLTFKPEGIRWRLDVPLNNVCSHKSDTYPQ